MDHLGNCVFSEDDDRESMHEMALGGDEWFNECTQSSLPGNLEDTSSAPPQKKRRTDNIAQDNGMEARVRAGSRVGKKLMNVKRMEDMVYHPKLIGLDDLCLRIVNSRQFQRLQEIRQLGACHHMFRSATHTRFQHALGVAYLAEKFIYKLIGHSAKLRKIITLRDIRCVKVAALCHDLGHGPFSHTFDEVFMRGDASGEHWKHEKMSVDMLEYLLEVNHIDLTQYGLELPEDMNFIRDCILGPERTERESRERTGDKEFLHDIVNNTRSGFDVDKMDYFLRDSRHCAPDKQPTWAKEKIFDSARVMKAKATPLKGEDPDATPTQICFPITSVKDASRWFETRSDLHQAVYTHSVVKAAELMICDVLTFVRDIPLLFVRDKNGKYGRITIAAAAWKPEYMEHMTDNILAQIKNLGDAGLNEDQRTRYFRALELLERLYSRDMYRCVGCCTLPEDMRDGDKKRSVVPKVKIEAYRNLILGGILKEAKRIVAEEAEAEGDDADGLNGGEEGNCEAANGGHDDNEEGSGTERDGDSNDDGMGQEENGEDGVVPINGSGAAGAMDCGAEGGGVPDAVPNGTEGAREEQGLTSEDLYVEITNIHWGQGVKNPVDSMRFYDAQYKDKDKRKTAIGMKPKLEHYGFAFQTYQQNRIRVFCKTREKFGLVARAMRAWWDVHHRPVGKASSDDTQHDFEHPQDEHEVFGSHQGKAIYEEDEEEEEEASPLELGHEQGNGAI